MVAWKSREGRIVAGGAAPAPASAEAGVPVAEVSVGEGVDADSAGDSAELGLEGVWGPDSEGEGGWEEEDPAVDDAEAEAAWRCSCWRAFFDTFPLAFGSLVEILRAAAAPTRAALAAVVAAKSTRRPWASANDDIVTDLHNL